MRTLLEPALREFGEQTGTPFSVRFADASELRLGTSEPRLKVRFNTVAA